MPKAGIHPTYYPKAKIVCSCGASYEIGATNAAIKLDICRECHPFYTGNQKLIDTAGRVDRFRAKVAKATINKKVPAKSPKSASIEPEIAPETTAMRDEIDA